MKYSLNKEEKYTVFVLDEENLNSVLAPALKSEFIFCRNEGVKNLIFGTISSFLTFFIISLLYKNSLSWFDFDSITKVAALPLLSLWAMIIGLIQSPIGNILSRKYEYEADRYAIESTLKPESFIKTLNKLTDQNLGDREPHQFVEWFFYSHPSIKNRINAIKNFVNEKGIVEFSSEITSEVLN